MSNKTSMLEVALGHARCGMRVFPIKAGAKSPPLVKDWPKLATADEAQVRSWWTHWPEANVGIATAGLVVVDVDPKKGGDASFRELERARGTLPATLTTETPSGGVHLYYRAAGVPSGVDVLGKGVDIRGEGGYVVAAGSATAAGAYTCDNPEAPIVDAPTWLVDFLKRAKPKAEPKVEAPAVQTDPGAAAQRALDFLRTHPVAIEGQGGDAHTYATVCRIRDFGVSQISAPEILAEWNGRCVPPWEPDDLATKIRNVYQYAQDPAGKLTPEALGFEAVEEQRIDVAPASGDVPAVKRRTLRPGTIALPHVVNVPYLIKGWLAPQSIAILFGKWGGGKTFLALSMCAHVAAGRDWFGRRTRQAGALFFGYEGDIALSRRLAALETKYPDWPWAEIPFEVELMRQPLIGASGGHGGGYAQYAAALQDFARTHRAAPGLVVVDTLRWALGGSDSDPKLTGPYMTLCAETAQRMNACILTLHHPGHGDTDRARGDSGLEAGADVSLRADGDQGLLVNRKQRDAAGGSLGYSLEVVPLGVDADGDPVSSCVAVPGSEQPGAAGLPPVQRALYDAAKAVCDAQSTFLRSDAVARCGLKKNSADRAWRHLAGAGIFLPAAAGKFRVIERGADAMFDEDT